MTVRSPVILTLGLITALAMVLAAGCVRRTVTIRTEPEGARVILNDEEIGTTPVSTDFTWYGDYSIIIRKDGYQTLQTNHNIAKPWYQVPPIDFIAEVIVPFQIHDQHEVSLTLEPEQTIDQTTLLENANQLRERALFAED